MFKWFKRKPTRVPAAPYTLESRSEREYREARIREISEIWERPLDYTASVVDKWVIHEVETTRWPDGPDEEGVTDTEYTATPLWDDEWVLSRESFPTHEQAEAYVNRIGGTLLYEIER